MTRTFDVLRYQSKTYDISACITTGRDYDCNEYTNMDNEQIQKEREKDVTDDCNCSTEPSYLLRTSTSTDIDILIIA